MTSGGPPLWYQPMLAQPTRLPDQIQTFRSGDWTYERKLDGLRCLAVRQSGQVELWSRNHLSFTARFPRVVAALRAVPVDPFVLDGEIVAFAGERTSFALLQNPEPSTEPVYSVFDALNLLGKDIRGVALRERRDLLARALDGGIGTAIRVTEQLEGQAEELLEQACRQGWEGLIAKRASSLYQAGRSPEWRKLKCSASQELVIGGWSEPSGSRLGFGALLVGYFDQSGGLRYAGRVGTGFSDRLLRELHRRLRDLETDVAPFADQVPAKGVHWVEPSLVAQVEFTEWTSDGKLRHPRFAGLRPDKDAREVVREDRM